MASPQEPPSISPKSSALQKTKTNLAYLALGSKAGTAPASIATRSTLTTARYVLKYVIRRLIRYAKYAAVGAIVAAVGGGLLGTVGSGIAFFAAPSIGVGMAIGVITAVAKFGWRHRGNHFRGGFMDRMRDRASAGGDASRDERDDAERTSRERETKLREKKNDVWMRV